MFQARHPISAQLVLAAAGCRSLALRDVDAAARSLSGHPIQPSPRGPAQAAHPAGGAQPPGSARIHIGTFDARSRGFRPQPQPDESYSLVKALCALGAVVCFTLSAALILGAV